MLTLICWISANVRIDIVFGWDNMRDRTAEGTTRFFYCFEAMQIIRSVQTFYFFARKNKLRGSICFLGGIALVFARYPFIGMLVEAFGFLNLFGYVCTSVSDGYVPMWIVQRLLSCDIDFPTTNAGHRHFPQSTVCERGKPSSLRQQSGY